MLYDPTSLLGICNNCADIINDQDQTATSSAQNHFGDMSSGPAAAPRMLKRQRSGSAGEDAHATKRPFSIGPLSTHLDSTQHEDEALLGTNYIAEGRGALDLSTVAGDVDFTDLTHLKDDSDSDDDEAFMDAPEQIQAEGADDEWPGEPSEQGGLFDDAFGTAMPTVESDDDEDDQPDSPQPTTEKEDEPDSTPYVPNDPVVQAQDSAKPCNHPRGPSTPPDSPKPTPATPSLPTNPVALDLTIKPIDPAKDLSRHQVHLRKFHSRALSAIPRLPLASHRYWIGVLNIDKKAQPGTIVDEKSYTWMRGNRLTTVRTVWHTYAQTTVSEGFVLVVAGGVERPGMDVKMEELDYCGDRKVFLRAIRENEVKGEIGERGVFWGLCPWDRRDDWDKQGKSDEASKGAKGVGEVIVLD
jgi:hypothetical protein